MICKECGNKIDDNSTFCKFCGVKIMRSEFKKDNCAFYKDESSTDIESDYETLITRGNIFLYLNIVPKLFFTIFLYDLLSRFNIFEFILMLISFLFMLICMIKDFSYLSKLKIKGIWRYFVFISPVIYTIVRYIKLKRYNTLGPAIVYFIICLLNISIIFFI